MPPHRPVWVCFGLLRRSAHSGASGGYVKLDHQALGSRDTAEQSPQAHSCPLANVFRGEFRGCKENELSEHRKQVTAGELLLILPAGQNTPKDLKTV